MARRERFHGRVAQTNGRTCDHPDCDLPGEFRAPRSRDGHGGEPYWFCLEHVRLYNERWDYFKGMTRAQLEAAAYHAYTWDRPTFPRHGQARAFPGVDDALNLFAGRSAFGAGYFTGHPGAAGRRLSAEDRQALETLGLDAGASDQEIKDRYRHLVRAYHPDANQGSRGNEAKLMAVIAAYKHIYRSTAA